MRVAAQGIKTTSRSLRFVATAQANSLPIEDSLVRRKTLQTVERSQTGTPTLISPTEAAVVGIFPAGSQQRNGRHPGFLSAVRVLGSSQHTKRVNTKNQERKNRREDARLTRGLPCRRSQPGRRLQGRRASRHLRSP